jgi:hypothetical protein
MLRKQRTLSDPFTGPLNLYALAEKNSIWVVFNIFGPN